ncbi:MAG: hypothetical protein IJX77_08025 [Ruminococcus sp.]|nr:hypothetical protein [Ruminococcus sp.]
MNFLDIFNDTTAQSTFDSKDVEDNKLIVTICYFLPILFFLPIIMNSNSAYCRFHANQILSWLVVGVVVGIVMAIIGIIPILGAILNAVIGLAILVVAILLMMSAYAGKAVRIPFVGSLIQIF